MTEQNSPDNESLSSNSQTSPATRSPSPRPVATEAQVEAVAQLLMEDAREREEGGDAGADATPTSSGDEAEAAPGGEASAAPDPDTQPDATAPEQEQAAADEERPVDYSGFAEALESVGLDAEKFWALEINTGDGETVTMGEVKDAYQSRQQAQRETAERELVLDQRETALNADQRIFASMGQDILQSVKPETLAQLKERLQARDQAERAKLLHLMPELKEQEHFDRFRRDTVDTMGDYGFAPHEVVVTDSRLLVMMRDFNRMKARLKALGQVKPKAPQPKARTNAPSTTSKPTGKLDTLITNAKRSGKHSDQVAAVTALITGQD